MRPLPKKSKAKAIEIASRLSFFKDIPPFELAMLTEAEQLLFFVPADEQIMKFGQLDDQSFYIVLSGVLSVYDQHCNFIREQKGGSFLGEIAFITGERRTANVYAQEDAILLRITQAEMNRFPATMRDKIKDKIITGLAHRIMSLNKSLQQAKDKVKY